eukprot:s864_g5.t1
MLSPRFRWLFDSLSATAQQRVRDLGITSVIDSNAWDDCDSFIAACADSESLDSVKGELRSLWTSSQAYCSSAVRHAVRDFIFPASHAIQHGLHLAKGASQPKSSVPRGTCAPSVLETNKRRKLAAPSVSEAEQHLQSLHARERAVVEAAVTELWRAFLEVGEASSHWQEYSLLSDHGKAQFATMLFDDMCMIAPSTLQAALRVLRRWRAYCQETTVSPWTASAIHVALWLRSLRERGPTAPAGAYNALKWLEKKIGLQFHSSVSRVHDQAAVPSSHVETQATPLSLAFIIGLEQLVSSKNQAVSALALTWILLTVVVLRFAHLQRSVIVRVLDNAISGRASLGKRRTQGRRRPFDWRAPRWGVTGLDIGSALHRMLLQAFPGGAQTGFLLPDFLPKRCTLQTATAFAGRDMPLGRFTRLSHSLFRQAPFCLSDKEASELSSYSARRVLPTVAELCRIDPHEMLLVGDWQSKRGQHADLSMPLRYADQKLHTSLCVKTELVCVMRHALVTGASAAWGWDKLSESFPSRPESRRQASEILKNGLPAIYLPESQTAEPGIERQDASSGSSSSSSSSSPTSDSDGESTVDTDPSEVQWLLSKGCKGHLHLCKPLALQSKRWHTVCNRGLSMPEVGKGLEDALDTGRHWSPRCFRALPSACQARWQEMQCASKLPTASTS